MKVELLKAESEWAQTSLGCYISVNGSLLDVVTPLNNPHEVNSLDIPDEGILRLVIRDMGRTDGYLGSISIPIEMIPNCHLIWLPLFTSPTSDILFQINEQVEQPRIMLAVITDTTENEPIYLQTCSADITSDNHHSKFLNSNEDDFFSRTSEFKALNEDKKQEVIDVLNLEIENFQEELSKEKEKNKALQKKVDLLMETVKNNSNRAVVRENSLLDLMNEKEKQINTSLEINIDLQNSVRKAELDKKLMVELSEKYESQENYVLSLENEVKRYQEMLKIADKDREELTYTLLECSHIDSEDDSMFSKKRQARTPDSLFRLDENMDKSRLKLKFPEKVLEEKVNGRLGQNAQSSDSEIKKIIQRSLGKEANKIERIRECLYKVNNVEMSLAICDDGLYVKSRNFLIPLDEYWNKAKKIRPTVSPVPIRKSPIWTDKETENEDKKLTSRTSPQKNFLKSTESSQNKFRTTDRFCTKTLVSVLRKRT